MTKPGNTHTGLITINTVEHDFNGHEVNGIHEVNGKKCHDSAYHLVNKMHDFKGIHDLSGNFCYDDFFRKTHARLYFRRLINILTANPPKQLK